MMKTIDDLDFARRLIVSVEGESGGGKSAFGIGAVVSRPPVYLYRFDFASEGVLRDVKSMGLGSQVYDEDYDISPLKETLETMDSLDLRSDKGRKQADEIIGDTRATATKILVKYQGDYEEGINAGGTVVNDTFSEVHELVRLAFFGRLKQVPPMFYERVNKTMSHFIRQAVFSATNLVMVNKLEDEWTDYIEDGKKKSMRTGNARVMGYKGAEYDAHNRIRVYRVGTKFDPDRGSQKVSFTGGDFHMVVVKANDRGDLVGQDFKVESQFDGFDQFGRLVYGEEW